MKLIDAKDFLDLFYVASAGQDKRFIKAVEMVVEDVPTVDAEPVRHAAWTYKDDDACYWWECNACGSGETMNTAYCPNCGAKMDRGVDNVDN